MDNMPDKFKAALDVFRTMLAKEGLREGVKVADDLLKELAEHKAPAPPAQETELWEECAKVIAGYYVRIDEEMEKGNNGSAESWEEQMIEYLQQKFTLSLKSEQPGQPEMEKFAEWCSGNKWMYNSLHQYWVYLPDQRRKTLKTYQLFQLFKTK